jgi:dTDP-4-amino-4,6-dideoxygalactose transaminase
LPQIILFKIRINNIYSSNLPTDIQLSSEFQNWRFNIITNKKKKILNEIFSNKLFASNHYSDMSFYFHRIRAENAYKIYNEVINLFNYKYINEIQAYKITEIINKNLE